MGVLQMNPSTFRYMRVLLASTLGAIYVTLGLQDWFESLTTLGFQCAVIVVTGLVAFGVQLNGIRNCGIYLLLHLAVAGLLQPASILRPWPLLFASILTLLLCALGFTEKGGLLVPVELTYGASRITLTALRDTGNTLHDPLTGKPVLVLGADAANNLTGLSVQQLRNPIDTMGCIPGLRLIPYRTVGGEGMLLALRLPRIKIGSHCGSGLVAFSPEVLSKEGKFQALTGGYL